MGILMPGVNRPAQDYAETNLGTNIVIDLQHKLLVWRYHLSIN